MVEETLEELIARSLREAGPTIVTSRLSPRIGTMDGGKRIGRPPGSTGKRYSPRVAQIANESEYQRPSKVAVARRSYMTQIGRETRDKGYRA